MQANFTPESDKLNDGIIGAPYYEQINISGGYVFALDYDGNERLVGDISPKDVGLYVQQCNEKMRNNCIQIKGVPTKPGIASIRVYGGIGGGMYSKAGRFDKTYTISIKGHD
ncbi:hypothetical protein OH773_10540 [Buttiauxella sp. WJP83]|uniref:hypothetical protein n=1 Tax=Buttiauxella sp. WJP83 TaxID=2986951 RepID=UPI0022DD8BEC|nr:hypothetical protein [Buttiauxella sp. WJP83]WBM72638.1 hypothetical protein OH773_10540 [Buttiauxella sp. WJP83]